MRLVILPVRHDGAQSSPAFVLPCLEITCRIVLFYPTHHSPQQSFLSPAPPCNSIRMPRVFVVWSFFFRFIQGIQVMGLSYGVIMVIFLGALVPAVANRNFQHQSKER